MNFGPLNKSGGYRRLNVAVTRAKYAVKLIGSILPTDMAINENSPQGVRLLRDYIDFAMNGASVLKNELDFDARFRAYSELNEPRRSYEATLPETARTIDKIVKSQSPVHVDLVCKQIAPLYGNERVSSKVRTAVENTIRLFASQYNWRMKGEFLWDSSQKQIVPARPSGQYSRTVDHISTEEVAEAMYIMADISFGPDQNALYDATARAFGFQRTTEKMRSRFDDALTLLLETLRLKENNGKYSVADNTL